jgi:N-acetylglucosaminyldiphosphoundecaprenol N-acetyl-beta-D-mannosaminyltransferase
MTDRLEVNVVLGVGAAFDINADLASRAPSWMQKIGMEWLYRLFKEPRRLAKRYLKNNPRFVWRVLRRRPRPMS